MSRALQKTAAYKREYGYNVFEDGSHSKLKRGVNEKSTEQVLARDKNGHYIVENGQLVQETVTKIERYIKWSPIESQSVYRSFHTHIGLGPTRFSAFHSDFTDVTSQDHFRWNHAFMANGSILHYRPMDGPFDSRKTLLGLTQRHLMGTSIF